MARRVGGRIKSSITVSRDRGVFMISVAAELAEMHPQTLRMYEARGLIEPQRSAKGTRLYSQDDVERLHRIQEMTTELGLNLAGVERVLLLEQELIQAQAELTAMRVRAEEIRQEMESEIDRVRRAQRAELVVYQRGGGLVPIKRPAPRAPDGSAD